MNLESIILKFFHDKSNTFVKDLLFNLKNHNKSSKSNSENNVINYIINSDEFNNYISICFEEKYCMYFEKDAVMISKLKNSFIQEVIKKNKCFDIDQINEYIKDNEQFNEYYYKLIKSLASLILNKKDIEDKDVFEIIKSFKTINLEDYFNDNTERSLKIINEIITRFIVEKFDDMEKDKDKDDILNKIHQKDREYFIIRHQKQFGKHSSINTDIVRFDEFIQNKRNLIDIYFDIVYNEIADEYFKNITNCFYNMFKREMTVYEYKNIYTLSKHQDYEEVIIEYKNRFDVKYKICENLHLLYTNTSLDIHYFCKIFFEYIDENDENYANNVINVLIDTQKYKTTMIDTIRDIYLNQFEKEINETDIDYYYLNIYREKLNLQDEKLIVLILELNKETNSFVNNINDLYEEVLNRKADDTEIIEGLNIYRSNVKLDPSHYIKNTLYESIEYNDVLKIWIVSTFKLSKNSLIYNILRYILEIKDSSVKRNKSLLEELIGKEFNL